MTDLASLVLGMPGYVEGFVKLGRTIIKFQTLERDHIESIEDAVFCAETLEYYASFVDVGDAKTLSHPSRPLLEESLVHAYDALDTAKLTLHNWTLRLNPIAKPHGRMILARFASSISEKIVRSKSGRVAGTSSPTRFSMKLLSQAAYLAFGVVEIKEAMTRLEKWITRFGQLLLTSPNLQLRQKDPNDGDKPKHKADDVAFVARARYRLTAERPVPVVHLEHLSSMFDIEPDYQSGVYRLEDGDFAGYMVDVRDTNLQQSRAAFQAENADTLSICRLFAELPSDEEVGARASVGILACAGYAKGNVGAKQYLLFRLPPGTGSPRTLRSLLISGSAQHSLNSRLEFCVKLATSVLIVHSVGLVHKNIRPESILITHALRSDTSPRQLGTPYLISFGQARLAEGPSDRKPYKGSNLSRTLYVHPRHTCSGKRKKWQMRDDIYSLGVCLFEIAIWRSLFRWDSNEGGLVCDFDLVPISDDHYEEILSRNGRSIHHDKVWMRSNDIIKYAGEMIPATMGETFRDIVVECLLFGDSRVLSDEEVLDKTDEDDTADDEAGSQSVMFVDGILTKLRKLVFAF